MLYIKTLHRIEPIEQLAISANSISSSDNCGVCKCEADTILAWLFSNGAMEIYRAFATNKTAYLCHVPWRTAINPFMKSFIEKGILQKRKFWYLFHFKKQTKYNKTLRPVLKFHVKARSNKLDIWNAPFSGRSLKPFFDKWFLEQLWPVLYSIFSRFIDKRRIAFAKIRYLRALWNRTQPKQLIGPRTSVISHIH